MRYSPRPILVYLAQPTLQRRFNGIATVFWIVMAPISALTSLKSSIEYLVFLSVYAIITGHASTWLSATVAVKQDEQIDASSD